MLITGEASAELKVHFKCQFYTDRSFAGTVVELLPGETKNLPRSLNDKVSSMSFIGSCVATIYEGANRAGKAMNVNGNTYDLRALRMKFDNNTRRWLTWDDQISSASCRCSG